MPLGGAISQLESELNDQIDAIKAKREAEKIPEVRQRRSLSFYRYEAVQTRGYSSGRVHFQQ